MTSAVVVPGWLALATVAVVLGLVAVVGWLAVAPKSNAVTTAIGAAISDVRAGKIGAVPPHLRDSHYPGASKLGHGTSYVYSHDEPFGVAEQQYAPDVVADAEYYQPTEHGAEAAVKQRWDRVRRIIRGLDR